MAKKDIKVQSSDVPDVNSTPASETRDTKLLVPLGRGTRGKTFFARWAIEQAFGDGNAPVVADIDRTNQTLARFFDGVLTPASADDADVVEFIAGVIEAQAVRRFDLVLDFGAGDLILKRLAKDMNLVKWLPTLGIRPVAIHVLGPNSDDLAYLEAMEEGGLFAPEATVVVLNEGVVPAGRSAHSAFAATINEHPSLAKTLERGAKLAVMPRLEPAAEIDAQGISFLDTAENRGSRKGTLPLGLWRAQQVALWRRHMAEAFAPVRHWLP